MAGLGPACEEYQNRVLRNLSCKRIQCDEVWSFCYAKQKNVSADKVTRLTNASSKKVENLGYAVALHFMQYNFRRVHQTLRVTPAMEAGIADHIWTIAEIIALLDKDLTAENAAA